MDDKDDMNGIEIYDSWFEEEKEGWHSGPGRDVWYLPPRWAIQGQVYRCSACRGTGKGFGAESCGVCEGVGLVQRCVEDCTDHHDCKTRSGPIPGWVGWKPFTKEQRADCRLCGATGDCPRCNGCGWVELIQTEMNVMDEEGRWKEDEDGVLQVEMKEGSVCDFLPECEEWGTVPVQIANLSYDICTKHVGDLVAFINDWPLPNEVDRCCLASIAIYETIDQEVVAKHGGDSGMKTAPCMYCGQVWALDKETGWWSAVHETDLKFRIIGVVVKDRLGEEMDQSLLRQILRVLADNPGITAEKMGEVLEVPVETLRAYLGGLTTVNAVGWMEEEDDGKEP